MSGDMHQLAQVHTLMNIVVALLRKFAAVYTPRGTIISERAQQGDVNLAKRLIRLRQAQNVNDKPRNK